MDSNDYDFHFLRIFSVWVICGQNIPVRFVIQAAGNKIVAGCVGHDLEPSQPPTTMQQWTSCPPHAPLPNSCLPATAPRLCL
mmetsp:Transcript_23094/g.39620  ORF Transcript_23094/g.39620 Transcript_23094/m.39620 type:complete len:82 (+) Transcript_23094:480-725(+)